MNNWNFNEVTQSDILDFKACQRQDKSIYGVPDKSDCQKGKEIKLEDLEKLEKAAKSGDKNASAQLKKINDVQREQEKKAKEEGAAKKAADKKKKAEAGGKGKKGGGKGKKGGGKGKGKGGGGKPESTSNNNTQKQQSKKVAMKRARETVQKLQKMLREVQDPEARKQIKSAIGDLLKSVVDATKSDIGGGDKPEAGQIQGQVQQQQEKQGS